MREIELKSNERASYEEPAIHMIVVQLEPIMTDSEKSPGVVDGFKEQEDEDPTDIDV
ncbi:MAG: hypothetical protein LBN29_05060 [Mediterranea sp.]|jgi:hypothetical protein|nr:hypothetical protein [Mediterranea sp.]